MATPTTHSIYGASGASRWRNCLGSVRVIEEAKANGDIPQEKETAYSKEGTTAHDYASEILLDRLKLDEIPDGFSKHLIGYVNHCRSVETAARSTGKHSQVLNEAAIPIFYRPKDTGTVDHAVVCAEFIHITDLKYGAGIRVYAEDNDQGLIYAISLLYELELMEGYEFDDETPVLITIYQPRHYTFDGNPDTWETTVGHLRAEAKEITADYKKAKDQNGEIIPSEKACLFCDAKGVCGPRANTSFGGMPSCLNIDEDFDFEDGFKPDLPTGRKATAFVGALTITPEQIAFICKNGATIKKVIEAVTEAERQRLIAGGEVRQMKLIPGPLGHRSWIDEGAAEALLRSLFPVSDVYSPRQLITAPQALKIAKPMTNELSTRSKLKLGLADIETTEKAKTQSLIHRPDGAPKLVGVEAAGDAIAFTSTVDDFDIDDDFGGDLL